MNNPFSYQQVVKNEANFYYILNSCVELFSDETEHGSQTVAEVDTVYYYLGDKIINIETAMDVWQYINNRLLTKYEIRNVIKDNEGL